uniref:Uncharacterized protein n=1 Tax=Brassica oleracea var. oleracea TaxID=109376 RepID=A0A0D3ALN2_BRAOL
MGQIQDSRDQTVVDLVETQKEDLLSSQPLSDDGDSTGASTNMFRLQINEMVEKEKGGRLVGLARRASLYPASSSQVPYTDPMILEQLQNKDERIVALEEQNATILAQLESQKKTNAEILEKLDRLLP